jgi:hypothetical protein
VFDVFIMDMGGHDENVRNLQTQYPHAKVVRYYNNHLDTLKRCITRCRTPYAWVISSCCSYDNFDFSYKAVPWEAYQLHCWASGTQEFGDTFLINVVEFNKQKNVDMLEWYKDINWHANGVDRLPWPLLECTSENVTAELTAYGFNTPYVWVNARTKFDAPLWKDRAFYSFNASNNVSLAPRDITGHLRTQIYDYPHILKHNLVDIAPDLLDIIYISNGEPNADMWYRTLINTVFKQKVHPARTFHRIKRIQNVNGRAAAYKAAANLSTTPWFFAVFAKLEVVDEFDWNWQPDYMQEPKHYIFHAKNPVNGLEYGHMGVIAYNKQLVLDTQDSGLDFTLSKAHAVVPLVSAIAHYNTTPELTWRTAFRECIKLRDDVCNTGNIESDYRLDVWLRTAVGANAEWSIKGAEDAIMYYDEVGGNYEKLMLTFEWEWLNEFYVTKYTL